MSTTSRAVAVLTHAVYELAQQLARVSIALADVAREQAITNLIVRSQVTADPEEKARLVAEALRRMDAPRWHPAPDPVWKPRARATTPHRR